MTIYLTPPSGGGAANVSSGTTGSEGTVRLATTAEAQDVNNETLAVTPKALNAQINSAVVGGIQYKGSIDAANIPTALLNANQGDFYKISVANASVAGTDWDIGDNLIVNTDMGGTFDAAKIDKIDSTDADLATVAVTGSYNDLSNTPNLATVATSGSYNDLTNKPTIPTNSTDLGDTTDLIRTTDVASTTAQGIVELATNTETATGTDSTRAVTPAGLSSVLGDYSQNLVVMPIASNTTAVINKAYYVTAAQGTAVTLTLPSVSSANTGDVIVVTRKHSGDLVIQQDGNDSGSLVNYSTGVSSTSHTISNNGQELFIRFGSNANSWWIFETANHAVATSGDYQDLTNKPTIPTSSDDITSDHTGTNYTGAQNASITTHLSGIDQAIANALGGTSDKIEEGQAKVEVVDTAGTDDATIQFWADVNNDGTSEKIWEFDKDGHLIPDVNATYDIGKADKKVRHLFLSDNSLQFGASNSNAITGTVSATSTHLKYKSVNLATEDYVGNQLGDYTESTALATVATSGSFADLSNVPTASDTVQGIVELADNTETAQGTSTDLAVTPAGLTHKLGDYTATSGLAAVATSGDYNDLTNTPSGTTPTALTADTTLVPNTEYVIPSSVSSTLTLNVPLTQSYGGGVSGYLSTQGEIIRVRNLSDQDVVIRRAAGIGQNNYNPLKYWTGDTAPNVGGNKQEIVIEGRGEITLVQNSSDTTLVEWWVHHSSAVEWDLDNIYSSGALFYDSTKRSFTVEGKILPLFDLTSNILPTTLKSFDYIAPTGHSSALTMEVPGARANETEVTALSGSTFFVENKGSDLITLNRSTGENNYSNPYYYRTYFVTEDNAQGSSLVIYSGERYQITVDYSLVNSNHYSRYHCTPVHKGLVKQQAVTPNSDYTVTSGAEFHKILLVNNGSNNINVFLPDVNNATNVSAKKEGYRITVQRQGTGTLTVKGGQSGAETIDGSAAGVSLGNRYDTATFLSRDGVGWWQVSRPTPLNSTDLEDTTDLVRTTDVASDTVQGIVELATNGETAIGTDSARAVTPAGLTHKLGDYTPTSGLPSFGTAATANATDFLSAIGSASLGGNLDVDGKDIISSSDGDIEIAPNGTGSLIVKGNTAASAINTGHLQLNCENNSHSVTIAAPTHSAINTGGSYTLTLPGSIGNPSDVLSTDSNGNLSWVAQSGGGGGGGSLPVVTEQTATITLSNPASGVTEEIHTVSSSSAVTITLALSATVTEGFKYQIKRLGTGGVTIQCGGSEFIDHSGQTSLTIDFQYDSITLVANGTSPTASWLLI